MNSGAAATTALARRPRKDALPEVLRTDLLPHAMNAGKEGEVRALLRAWRRGAVLVGREQWRLYFEAGRLNKNHLDKSVTPVVGAANRLQMVRWQVVGVLKSYLASRENDFRRIVQRSSLSSEVKHQLNFINTWGAHFSRESLVMKDGAEIPPDVRALARRIMRQVLKRHRRPRLDRISMMLDQRAVEVRAARAASHFGYWARVSTMTRGKKVEVPLVAYPYFLAREGRRKQALQVSEKKGRLYFGVITDIGEACRWQKLSYQPKVEEIALDFGLRTLFASDQGDLLGRGFLEVLKPLDEKITRLAGYRQSRGLRVSSPRYRAYVQQMRGFITSEVNRVLNRLAEVQRPGHIAVERLNFRSPLLSRRMNRLVSRCGRAAVRAKLKDLEEKYGITSEERNAAYSSQECAGCHYVDFRNRGGEQFRCLWCGRKRHADVNAGGNLRQRRSLPYGSVRVSKADTLRALVAQHVERNPGPRGRPSDPRLTNPYFREWSAAVTSSCNDALPF